MVENTDSVFVSAVRRVERNLGYMSVHTSERLRNSGDQYFPNHHSHCCKYNSPDACIAD